MTYYSQPNSPAPAGNHDPRTPLIQNGSYYSGAAPAPGSAPPPGYYTVYGQPVHVPVFVVTAYRRRPRTHWGKFICLAITAAILYTSVVSVGAVAKAAFESVVRWRHGYGEATIPDGVTVKYCLEPGDWNPALKGAQGLNFSSDAVSSQEIIIETPVYLPGPNDYPYTDSHHFTLPIKNSDLLFLISKGSISSGLLDIVTSDKQEEGKVSVDVEVKYWWTKVRDSAKVCLVTGQNSYENGVGLFAPDHRWSPRKEERLFFHTTVTFPQSQRAAAELLIKQFETDMSNTIHRIGDLKDKVFFDSVSLRATNGQIESKGLAGEQVRVKTSNGEIQGSFVTHRLLLLGTTNGKINVDAELLAQEDKHKNVATVCDLQSSNGRIDARVGLLSKNPDTHADFDVSTRTTNGGLDVSFPVSPVDSTLKLEARTSNGGAKVSLNPAYEGAYHLRTTNGKATVIQDETVKDPSGRNRRRYVQQRMVVQKKEILGKVRWEDGDGHGDEGLRGTVNVQTTNGPVKLEL